MENFARAGRLPLRAGDRRRALGQEPLRAGARRGDRRANGSFSPPPRPATPKWPSASPAIARERGAGWRTREEPLELAAALRAEARPGRVVLVDCLTLWLSNLMLAGRDIEAQISELTEVLSELGGPAVADRQRGRARGSSRRRRSAAPSATGRAGSNQQVAAACDAVVSVAAGLPTLLKPAPRPDIRLR